VQKVKLRQVLESVLALEPGMKLRWKLRRLLEEVQQVRQE